MSDTPKTDAFISKFYKSRPLSSGSRHRTDVELHDFARQLERELTALRGLLGRAAVAVKWGINDEYDQHAKGAAAGLLQEINAALKEEGK